MESVKYKHPSASPNQPPAESVTALHKVVKSDAPAGGVAKLTGQATGSGHSGDYSNEQQ